MPTIQILVEGYGREESDGERASSTVTLIRDGGINIIVDPGMDRRALLDILAENRCLPILCIHSFRACRHHS